MFDVRLCGPASSAVANTVADLRAAYEALGDGPQEAFEALRISNLEFQETLAMATAGHSADAAIDALGIKWNLTPQQVSALKAAMIVTVSGAGSVVALQRAKAAITDVKTEVTGRVGVEGPKATEPLKALPAPRQIDASWSSNTYKHGGLMTGIEHVFYRHGPDSGFSNTSKFAAGTSLKDVSNYVDSALRYGKVSPNGPGGYVVEYNVGKIIGVDVSGKPTSTLKVNVRDGIINTAFPK